ncbi:FG-GAP repeat domain-containing protein [Actinotalea solisilvae]|uniref:FG-GAP repeat domain-containing protein n=1 Tax=Actinotalea solisilvae TaxID=2072922 RepID=UPI0018F20F9B|nr:VCBS repeat-containing protein [Actinotalea solisilvae]
MSPVRHLWKPVATVLAAVGLAVAPSAAPLAGAADDVELAVQPPGGGTPDLTLVHALPGGMNLWHMPLAEVGGAFAAPQLATTLASGGFSYAASRTLAGDFGDITGSDDGTADQVVWHAQPDDAVILWAVPGAADRAPRLWATLRGGGWSWRDSTPVAGDVNADGWDDLVVLHRNGPGTNIWVFLSDGTRLAETPSEVTYNPYLAFGTVRAAIADVSGDGYGEIVLFRPDPSSGGVQTVVAWKQAGSFAGAATGVWVIGTASGGGWSYAGSRQLIGTVRPGGTPSIIHLHAQGANPGILVWEQPLVPAPGAPGPAVLAGAPEVWQDLRSGGWSWTGSRQVLADTNADGLDDLVSVHDQGAAGGELVWRHVSTGAGLLAPQVIADLRTGGWSFGASREDVAVPRPAALG